MSKVITTMEEFTADLLKAKKEHYKFHSKHNPEAWFLKNDEKHIKHLEAENKK